METSDVILTMADVVTDDADARRDQERACRNNWRAVGYQPPGGDAERLQSRILAYRAERAASFYLGVPFERDPDGFGKPDVGGYSVRMGSKANYGLVIHSHDKPEQPYLLVVHVADGLHFRVVGTIDLGAARRLKARRVGIPQKGSTDAWAIPQRCLRPVARGTACAKIA